jgi:O-antigen/teichoic acid export membrane protein
LSLAAAAILFVATALIAPLGLPDDPYLTPWTPVVYVTAIVFMLRSAWQQFKRK